MAFKFVYVLVSGENDFYAEQAAVSMHSLRRHNPDSHIVLMTDVNTLNLLVGNRSLVKNYVNEFVTVETPSEFTPKERSRFLKTFIRQNIEGDFLFLDCDTVIAGDLSVCEELDCEIGAVLDCHQITSKNGQFLKYLAITKRTVEEYDHYFNAGVLFVRDTDNARKFYEEWHILWSESRSQYGITFDQPAFALADAACGHLVREIDGRFNCQIVLPGAKRYLFDALVIHYMSDLLYFSSFPLKNKQLLAAVRDCGITDNIEKIVSNPQLAFLESSCVLGGEELEIYKSPVMVLARKLSRDFKWLNKVVRFFYGLAGYKI